MYKVKLYHLDGSFAGEAELPDPPKQYQVIVVGVQTYVWSEAYQQYRGADGVFHPLTHVNE